MKTPTKRVDGLPSKTLLLKPFQFCCDPKNQNSSDIRYGTRKHPFESSMTNVLLENGGPGLKFRLQDIGKPTYPISRVGTVRVKDRDTYLGYCKRCRGPLKWYLEDEIAVARDLLANDRQTRYNTETERNVKRARKKERKRRNRRRKAKAKRRKDG